LIIILLYNNIKNDQLVYLQDNYQVIAIMLGPERWWSICVYGKARRNSGGGL